MPSATAALVALIASSNASFFDFISDFGRGADTDHGDAASELRQPLLQFLLIVIARRLLDLAPDLLDAPVDLATVAGAANDRGVLLVDDDALGAPELLDGHVFELEADSSETTWPPVRTAISSSIALRRSPKPGALTAQLFRRAADVIDDQRRQRFALDVLGYDQQRRPAFTTSSSSGSRSLRTPIFRSEIRTSASSITASIFSGLVMK